MNALRVVLAHRSSVARDQLTELLQSEGDIAVIAACSMSAETIDIVRARKPDVLVLSPQLSDRGSGQEVIEELMATSPVPILVLSSARDSEEAVSALMAGAVDVLPEPRHGDAGAAIALRARVRIVGGVAVVRRRARRAVDTLPAKGGRTELGVPVVAIGASTGGPAALATVLAELGRVDAVVLVVQHLHADFVGGLVSWMDRVSPLHVVEAAHGAPLRTGTVYVAPAGMHLRVGKDDVMVLDPKPETLHRPSVDELFTSLAERRSGRTIGVLLTGMGEDGAAGLLALRRRGHVTIAQDEQTSVVFGMPRAAQRMGAAMRVLPLDEIAAAIVQAS